MRFRRPRAEWTPDRRVIWQASSLLLAYPDESFGSRLELVGAAVESMAPAARDPLRRCVDALTALDPVQAAVAYVDTFDWRRRRTLFLTYYTAGDTRGRGMALLEFAQAYRAAGATPPTGELPDHLAVVLEFAATVDADAGFALLAAHRMSIDLLLDGLRKMDSPYAAVVQTVADTLPAATEGDRQAAQRLAMQGPPVEAVGLDPYPTPGPVAAPAGRSGPIDLPLVPSPRIPAGKGVS